jgi:hypothetical protein
MLQGGCRTIKADSDSSPKWQAALCNVPNAVNNKPGMPSSSLHASKSLKAAYTCSIYAAAAGVTRKHRVPVLLPRRLPGCGHCTQHLSHLVTPPQPAQLKTRLNKNGTVLFTTAVAITLGQGSCTLLTRWRSESQQMGDAHPSAIQRHPAPIWQCCHTPHTPRHRQLTRAA